MPATVESRLRRLGALHRHRGPRPERGRATATVLLIAGTVLGALGPLAAGALAPTRASAAGFPSMTVSVGYADSLRANGFFPTPWSGASGVTFEGCSPASSCTYDAGAIELVNTSGSTETINSVSVQLNAPGDTSSCVVNIWPSNVSLPAGGTLIDTQTASGSGSACPSGGEFDTSDVGPNGSSWVGQCANSGVIPLITVTANGAAQTYTDASQVMNTGGIDPANCSGMNESEPWTQVATAAVFTGFNAGSGNGLAGQITT